MISVLNDSIGYIGSHTCKALAEASFTPIAYDSLTPRASSGQSDGALVRDDILDRGRLDGFRQGMIVNEPIKEAGRLMAAKLRPLRLLPLQPPSCG